MVNWHRTEPFGTQSPGIQATNSLKWHWHFEGPPMFKHVPYHPRYMYIYIYTHIWLIILIILMVKVGKLNQSHGLFGYPKSSSSWFPSSFTTTPKWWSYPIQGTDEVWDDPLRSQYCRMCIFPRRFLEHCENTWQFDGITTISLFSQFW